MDQAARNYERALDDRDAVRKRPPHDPLELQNKVKNYSGRLHAARDKILQIVRERYGPTRGAVTRPVSRGIYSHDGRILMRRGQDGPALAFWNLRADATRYLEQNGREWTSTNAQSKVSRGKLDEYWGPGGLR